MSLGVPLKAGGGSFMSRGTRLVLSAGLSLGVSAACKQDVMTKRPSSAVDRLETAEKPLKIDFIILAIIT